ncbi:hypothetical protein L2E82_04098 [Cichorium intybus]|uniref:Uncharacterized protein n=1 Tax=Cichorium intybus TaxID=13427 RepID=A0ACB9H5J7_CICIN|nr:hypothetical protein L2E82_04098 [Cichorium intybus]
MEISPVTLRPSDYYSRSFPLVFGVASPEDAIAAGAFFFQQSPSTIVAAAGGGATPPKRHDYRIGGRCWIHLLHPSLDPSLSSSPESTSLSMAIIPLFLASDLQHLQKILLISAVFFRFKRLRQQRFKSFTVKMETYHWKRSKRARQFLLERNYEVSEEEDVELGSIYEIDHKNLPPRTPVQLRSIRVVLVSEKRDLNVAIRYPSILSLRAYFSHGITEMYPALDEKFAMGIKLAGKVLFREVPSQELAEKKHLQDFWLVNPNTQDGSGHAVLD